ncbi:hypothetical protein LshimejAT787_2200850 [Lyophyllum shimeji]|uniref:Uncharacterized protein n=1 Tax=Lyophyllum shimeji TaxID=47721 RepID=A0A9P3Q251_LYOSH|nr:hypothetical protein LshimejAT787_2200850 [Lyophyllum shimeji]
MEVDEERRKDTSAAIEAKSGDGCRVRLGALPLVDGGQFLARKKQITTNVQATVDHQNLFTSFELGWPGSGDAGYEMSCPSQIRRYRVELLADSH